MYRLTVKSYGSALQHSIINTEMPQRVATSTQTSTGTTWASLLHPLQCELGPWHRTRQAGTHSNTQVPSRPTLPYKYAPYSVTKLLSPNQLPAKLGLLMSRRSAEACPPTPSLYPTPFGMGTPHAELTLSLTDAFNALADEAQGLNDRRIVLEHKLRFAHEQVSPQHSFLQFSVQYALLPVRVLLPLPSGPCLGAFSFFVDGSATFPLLCCFPAWNNSKAEAGDGAEHRHCHQTRSSIIRSRGHQHCINIPEQWQFEMMNNL